MENRITGYAAPYVADFLQADRTGTVLMANSAGIYLQLDGQILLLCDSCWGQVPMGIGMENYARNAKELALAPGDQVICRNGSLHFSKDWITITKINRGSPALGAAAFCCRDGIRALRGRKTGLAPLADAAKEAWNPWCALAAPRLEALCGGISSGDTAAIDGAVESLLGLGPGLTPSADDVLCGLLYALLRSPAADTPAVGTLKTAICAFADSRTHPVSAAYLKAIARGEVFSRLEDAWLGREGSLEALLEVGSSSGGDMLLGLILAVRILGMEECTDG